MAVDSFVQFTDIPGESTDDGHADWCELGSFSQGVHQPTSATSSSVGGGSAERCEHSPFRIEMKIDKAYPKLAEACSSGQHIPEVIVECCRAGGDKLKYLEIKMTDVVLGDVEITGFKEADVPTISVAIKYGKIVWTYTEQDKAKGGAKGNVGGGWDLEKNVKAA